ncbi:MAG TPA: hypothetical protein VMM56_16995 [Planctomycetaceae bacterium]|nr:hypothetical protein [Planctomycetaceae bacterium]
MAWAEKMVSARFFSPEDLKRLQMTEDGVRIDSPSRSRSLLWSWTAALLLGMVLATGVLVYQNRESVVPRLKVQFVKLFTAIRSIGDEE